MIVKYNFPGTGCLVHDDCEISHPILCVGVEKN